MVIHPVLDYCQIRQLGVGYDGGHGIRHCLIRSQGRRNHLLFYRIAVTICLHQPSRFPSRYTGTANLKLSCIIQIWFFFCLSISPLIKRSPIQRITGPLPIVTGIQGYLTNQYRAFGSILRGIRWYCKLCGPVNANGDLFLRRVFRLPLLFYMECHQTQVMDLTA